MNSPASTPVVSVLMTIYNAEPYLQESIESLLAQSFSDWELIAVENGSADGSPAILSGYNDSRIKVFPLLKNIGRTPALQYALEQARGKYVAVLDADDVSHPERLAKEVQFLAAHPDVVLVGTWIEQMDAAGKVFRALEPPTDNAALLECLGWRDPIANSSVMYRRDKALAVGGYPQQYTYSQDYALILELVRLGKIAVIGEQLCRVRIFPGNMTNAPAHRVALAQEGIALLRQAAQVLPLSSRARRMNRCAIAKYEIRYGIAILRRGEIWGGLRKILAALWHDPEVLWVNKFFRAPYQPF